MFNNQQKVLRIHPKDNVLVALINLKNGDTIDFEKLENVEEEIVKLNAQNIQDKHITSEGFVLLAFTGEKFKSPFKILKLQTEIYQKIQKMKPNNSNIFQCYMELYQTDKLKDFLQYFVPSHLESQTINRITGTIQCLASELKYLYHVIHPSIKRNKEIYDVLTPTYKTTLYKMHGIYLARKETDKTPIQFNEIFNMLKSSEPFVLRQLLFDRFYKLSCLPSMGYYINFENKSIYRQTQLMFP